MDTDKKSEQAIVEWKVTEEFPEIPPQLISAAEEKRLILFVGNGVSRNVGYPSWSEFAENLINELIKSDDSKFNYSTKKQIEQLGLSPKQILSIALRYHDRNIIDFDKILTPKEPIKSDIIYNLRKIGRNFVTTNYDELLEEPHQTATASETTDFVEPGTQNSGRPADQPSHPKCTPVVDPGRFRDELSNRFGAIIHLHGSISDKKSLVITASDYLKLYSRDKVKDFLKTLFSDYTVLFVGYRLDEVEVLEHIFRNGANNSKGIFILYGVYSHEEQTFEFMKEYYNNFNATLIPYCMDRYHYKQLDYVLEKWASTLSVEEQDTSEDARAIINATKDEDNG